MHIDINHFILPWYYFVMVYENTILACDTLRDIFLGWRGTVSAAVCVLVPGLSPVSVSPAVSAVSSTSSENSTCPWLRWVQKMKRKPTQASSQMPAWARNTAPVVDIVIALSLSSYYLSWSLSWKLTNINILFLTRKNGDCLGVNLGQKGSREQRN